MAILNTGQLALNGFRCSIDGEAGGAWSNVGGIGELLPSFVYLLGLSAGRNVEKFREQPGRTSPANAAMLTSFAKKWAA